MWIAAAQVTAGVEAEKPATATGRVLDVHGRPVAGAVVDVSITNQRYESVTIGVGTTDVDGRFALTLATRDYGDLGLGVEAPGFASWGRAGFPDGIVGEEIFLQRVIERGFLERLRSTRDPVQRARGALEIAASDHLADIEELFPYLGELRPELAAIARAGISAPRTRPDGPTPAGGALRLLAYAADPADDDLVEPWMVENWNFRPAPALSGASFHEVCERWREAHFAQQGIGEAAPRERRHKPVLDASGRHALLLWRVDYLHWGYSMYLVMRREGDRWVLRGVSSGAIHHHPRD